MRLDAWPPPTTSAASPEPGSPERVQLRHDVTRHLHRQLHRPARTRGGLLFGQFTAGTLSVLLASSASPPPCATSGERGEPGVDHGFALGWSEAVGALWGGQIDWVGHWAAHEDGQVGSRGRDRRLLRRGRRVGLVNDRHVLVIPGWIDGELTFRAYVEDAGGKACPLAVGIQNLPLPDLPGTPADLP